MRFAVCVLRPPGYAHAAAFDEVALTLQHGLRALGHDSRRTARPDVPGRTTIVLGANLLAAHPRPLAEEAVLYNLEQISPDSAWCGGGLLDVLRSRPCWDYSEPNARALAAAGARVTAVVPLGYAPELTRIGPAEEDVDVLFYGSLNERRAAVLRELEARGLRVKHLFGVYGPERDAWVARSRIVLNLHYYEAKVFEAVRVTYLLANRRFVISERGADPAEEAPFEPGLVFAGHDDLAETCAAWAGRAAERRRVAEAGLELMRARPVERFLEPALATLVPA